MVVSIGSSRESALSVSEIPRADVPTPSSPKIGKATSPRFAISLCELSPVFSEPPLLLGHTVPVNPTTYGMSLPSVGGFVIPSFSVLGLLVAMTSPPFG